MNHVEGESEKGKFYFQFSIRALFCSFDTPERTSVFDDSGLGFLGGRDLCSDLQSEGSCLQLKSEPHGPSSPESTSDLLSGPEDCAGCGRLIQVRR